MHIIGVGLMAIRENTVILLLSIFLDKNILYSVNKLVKQSYMPSV